MHLDPARSSRRDLVVFTLACALAVAARPVQLTAAALINEPEGAANVNLRGPFRTLADAFFTDSSAAVLKLDFKTGKTSVVAVGPPLIRPYSVAWGGNGKLLVGDTGANAVFEVDPHTPEANPKPLIQGPLAGSPFGLAVSPKGEIYIADSRSILKFNPATRELLANCKSNSLVTAPLALAFDHQGLLLVANARGGIVRLDPENCTEKMVAEGGELSNPTALAATPQAIYVAEYETRKIIRIDCKDGKAIGQTAWTLPPGVGGAVGLVVAPEGGLILGCPDAHKLSGAVVHFDPATTKLTVLTVGSGDYVNPRCVVLTVGPDAVNNSR